MNAIMSFSWVEREEASTSRLLQALHPTFEDLSYWSGKERLSMMSPLSVLLCGWLFIFTVSSNSGCCTSPTRRGGHKAESCDWLQWQWAWQHGVEPWPRFLLKLKIKYKLSEPKKKTEEVTLEGFKTSLYLVYKSSTLFSSNIISSHNHPHNHMSWCMVIITSDRFVWPRNWSFLQVYLHTHVAAWWWWSTFIQDVRDTYRPTTRRSLVLQSQMMHR